MLRHRDRKPRLGDRVHRRADERNVQANVAREPRRDVNLCRHDLRVPRHEQHVVEGERGRDGLVEPDERGTLGLELHGSTRLGRRSLKPAPMLLQDARYSLQQDVDFRTKAAPPRYGNGRRKSAEAIERRRASPQRPHHQLTDAPWHFLYFFPLPHGHGSLRPTFAPSCRTVLMTSSPPARAGRGANGLASGCRAGTRLGTVPKAFGSLSADQLLG